MFVSFIFNAFKNIFIKLLDVIENKVIDIAIDPTGVDTIGTNKKLLHFHQQVIKKLNSYQDIREHFHIFSLSLTSPRK